MIDFDERIQVYCKIQQDIADQSQEKDIEFIHLQLHPLINSLRDNAQQWILSLGKILNESTREALTGLKTELEV